MCKALLLVLLLSAPTKPDRWLVVPGKRVGPLTAQTRRADLVRIFGAKNVKDAMRSAGGDSEPEPATTIFPGKPDAELTIFWVRKIESQKRVTSDQTIDVVDLCPAAHTCKWHLASGLSLGSSLRQLEAWNGGAFVLTGFGWDYSGTVVDWKKGKLDPLLRTCRRLMTRVDWQETDKATAAEKIDYNAVTGDRDILSSEPAMQRLNPRIYQIEVGLAPEQHCPPFAEKAAAQEPR